MPRRKWSRDDMGRLCITLHIDPTFTSQQIIELLAASPDALTLAATQTQIHEYKLFRIVSAVVEQHGRQHCETWDIEVIPGEVELRRRWAKQQVEQLWIRTEPLPSQPSPDSGGTPTQEGQTHP